MGQPSRSDVETWLESSGFEVLATMPVPSGDGKVLVKVPTAAMHSALTPQQARALATWLEQAADMAEFE
jgi:hypothetical protein